MSLMTKRRESSEVTSFGYYFSALLKDRHFDNLTQYSEELKGVGRGASPQMISRYRREGTNVPLWFVADSIEVLELDEAETDKFVGLWLDTLPGNQRAVMERLWSKRSASRPEDVRDLEEYERQRESREDEGDEGGGAPGDR